MIATDMHGKELLIGQRCQIYWRRADGLRKDGLGIIVGIFPQDPQGIPGLVTIDTGSGCQMYVPPSRVEVL